MRLWAPGTHRCVARCLIREIGNRKQAPRGSVRLRSLLLPAIEDALG